MMILSITAVGLLCALSSSFGLTAEAESENKIIGGSQAKRNQFPYMVSIRDAGRYISGAVIISPKWVISAAKIVGLQRKTLTVVAGELDLYDYHSDVQEILVKRVVVHSSFDKYLPYYDIALLLLHAPFTFNEAVQPAALPEADERRTGHMVLSGWGLISNSPPTYASTLQYIEMPVITNQECNKINANKAQHGSIDYLVKDTMLCTLPSENQTGCLGDYGGPLVQNEVLVGIFVNQNYPCEEGSTQVFTKVSAFRDFIDRITSTVY